MVCTGLGNGKAKRYLRDGLAEEGRVKRQSVMASVWMNDDEEEEEGGREVYNMSGASVVQSWKAAAFSGRKAGLEME